MQRDLEALDSFQKAITLKPDYGLAYSGLAWTYNRLGRHQEALENAQKAIRLLPREADCHYNLAIAYLGLGQQELAMEKYHLVNKLKPELGKLLLSKINKTQGR